MPMQGLRKITRLLLKTVKYTFILCILLLVFFVVAINTEGFQTWLANRVTTYISDELGTKVSIARVRLAFVKSIKLDEVYIEDKNKDTLIYSKLINIELSNFSFDNKHLRIDLAEINQAKIRLIKCKNDSTFNFNHLIEYFSSGDTDTSRSTSPWDIKYKKMVLNNVDFLYKDETKDISVSKNVNFNNIHLKKLSGNFSNINLINDSVYTRISGLTFREQSGLYLKNLNTSAKIGPKNVVCKNLILETPDSKIKGTLSFRYNDWSDYDDFINKVNLYADLKEDTRLHFKDLAYFVSELNDFNNAVTLSGKVKGTVSDLKVRNLFVGIGEKTNFKGNIVLKGLPHINSTYFDLNITKVTVSKKDLEKIAIYPFSNEAYLALPKETERFGLITYSGKLQGHIYDFVSYGNFQTAIGNISTDVNMRIDTVNQIVKYDGKIATPQFNIGTLFGAGKLGNVMFNTRIKGQGFTINDVNAEFIGNIAGLQFNNYNYKDISLTGTLKNKLFIGQLLSGDQNADFDFNGKIDFSGKIPDMDFISSVNKINLKALHFTEVESEIATQILINFKGDDINNLTGNINFDNTIYKKEGKDYKLSTFDLTLHQETAEKQIKLMSTFFNLNVAGYFNLTNLSPAAGQFLYHYYPAFFPKNKSKTTYTDALTFKLTVKQFKTIKELFVNDLMVSPNTILSGNFEASKNLLNINFSSDSVSYGALKFNNNKIESYSKDNKINLVFKGDNIQLTDSVKLSNYFMYIVSNNLNTKYNLEWDNKSTPKTAGRFAGKLFFDTTSVKFDFDEIFVTAKDSTWRMTTSSPAIIDTSGSAIINPLLFVNNNQLIGIQGALTNKPGDKLDFNIKNFNLMQLSPFLGNALKIEGKIDGSITLHNSFKNLVFGSELSFDKVKINDKDIGNGELKTEYFPQDKYVYIDGYTSLGFINPFGQKVKNISFSGYYYTNKKEESIDISFEANPANLTLLNPYLEGIITLKTALVKGSGKLSGTPEKLNVNAELQLVKCDVKVDYTNVTYSMLGKIEIFPDQIRFDEIKITDNPAKKIYPGSMNGNIFHSNFSNMRIDYDINFNNMLVLNTTSKENATFFGKTYATGSTGIYGFLNNIKLEINARTEKNSQFSIALDGPSEVSDNSFIRFVTTDTTKKIKEEAFSGFSLDMNVKATSEAEAQIIFDAKSGDVIKARGNGDLQLKISNLGKFDMFGEYVIASGDYLFTLENFITKRFEIEKGSSLSWSGNPFNAEIDIAANYKQRASLAPLFPMDTTGTYKKRYPVDCKLLMRNKLLTPDISFAIELPTIDESTRSRVKSIFLDDNELNRQVFSLLLLKSFVTPLQFAHAGGVSAGSAMAANSSEMLSNRISGWLNGLTNDVDIGVNYRPGTQLSNDELDIALSKQLLNNRLSIDGNLGVNNNQTANSSALIGDVNVEYKLTEDGKFRIKGFNRSNDNTQITTSGGPFTQGVGTFYREEFETWNEVYKRYLKKIKPSKSKQ